MKKTKTKEKKELPPKNEKCFFCIKVDDIVFEKKAKTIKEAVDAFVASPKFPYGVKTKVIIKFGNDKDEKIEVWGAVRARRIFSQIKLKPYSAELLAERLTSRLANQ